MIPEIYDILTIISFLREKHHRILEQVESESQYWKLIFIESSIEELLYKKNKIAKEHGNSYYDDEGKIVWVPSLINYKEKK